MPDDRRKAGPTGERRRPPPLDAAALEALAFAYVARFATSAARLEAYLIRKLRQRGEDAQADDTDDTAGDTLSPQARVRGLVARLVAQGYVDDAGFAQARAAGLARRGYGARRIVATLHAAGIAEELTHAALPDSAAARQAALAMARKRRFGPWGDAPPDPARMEKQLAALLRAGHPLASARALVRARSIAEAEDWAATPEDR